MSTDPRHHAPSAAAPRARDEDDAPFPEDPRLRVMRRLVNALLVVMIAGVLTITISLLMTLKDMRRGPAAGLSEVERIVAAEATADRVALTIENTETGARRVVLLDGRSFEPLASIDER